MMKRQPEMRRARAKAVLEMTIKGVPQKDIAEHFNVSPRRVRQITLWGKRQGLIEEVSMELSQKTLPSVVKVFSEVLDKSAEDIDQHAKGHAVRIKAATEIAKGLGVFRTHKADQVRVEEKLDLDGYHKLRNARSERSLPPHVIDGDVVEEGDEE